MQEFFSKGLVATQWACKRGELVASAIDTLTGEGSVIMVRGKKRIGYELELKIKFEGRGKYEGTECAIKLKDLCDDGSDPDCRLYVTKEKSKEATQKLKAEINSERVLTEVMGKCRELLQQLKDEV